MPDDEPELSERYQRALELFRAALIETPRGRGPLLAALNDTLRPLKMGVVMMGGRKYG